MTRRAWRLPILLLYHTIKLLASCRGRRCVRRPEAGVLYTYQARKGVLIVLLLTKRPSRNLLVLLLVLLIEEGLESGGHS